MIIHKESPLKLAFYGTVNFSIAMYFYTTSFFKNFFETTIFMQELTGRFWGYSVSHPRKGKEV
jgi:hypothetical protein